MKNSKIFVCTYMDLSSYTTHLHNDGSSICGRVYSVYTYVGIPIDELCIGRSKDTTAAPNLNVQIRNYIQKRFHTIIDAIMCVEL